MATSEAQRAQMQAIRDKVLELYARVPPIGLKQIALAVGRSESAVDRILRGKRRPRQPISRVNVARDERVVSMWSSSIPPKSAEHIATALCISSRAVYAALKRAREAGDVRANLRHPEKVTRK